MYGVKAELVWQAPPSLHELLFFLLTIAFSFVRDIDRYAKVIGQHTLKHQHLLNKMLDLAFNVV